MLIPMCLEDAGSKATSQASLSMTAVLGSPGVLMMMKLVSVSLNNTTVDAARQSGQGEVGELKDMAFYCTGHFKIFFLYV